MRVPHPLVADEVRPHPILNTIRGVAGLTLGINQLCLINQHVRELFFTNVLPISYPPDIQVSDCLHMSLCSLVANIIQVVYRVVGKESTSKRNELRSATSSSALALNSVYNSFAVTFPRYPPLRTSVKRIT